MSKADTKEANPVLAANTGRQIVLIPIEQIIPPSGWTAGEGFVQLKNSIEELGLLNPISVVPVSGENDKYEIVAGRDRFNAVLAVGWSEIPAILQAFDRTQCEIAEIDENLFRKGFSPLETAFQLKKRKALHKDKSQIKKSEVTSFLETTSSQMGLSPRSIQQYVYIAEQLAEDVPAAIRGTPFEHRKEDLLLLAREDHTTQRACVGKMKSGDFKTVGSILESLHTESPDKEDSEEYVGVETAVVPPTILSSKKPTTKEFIPSKHYLGEKVITQEERKSSSLEIILGKHDHKKSYIFEVGLDGDDPDFVTKVRKAIERIVKKH